MRFTIVWEQAATDGMKRLRQRDGDAVKPFIRAINGLATNPEPPESSKLGVRAYGACGSANIGRRTRSTATGSRSI
ncbi:MULTISPECIES: hypothetical protein [unclassified Streptomyces]|uniref:hypothetical protein n=1 Tax=unclassified Streptomyces TaxID=2593676 RepID=UPI002E2820D7|nr:hypothetical protein [Streptomyces sp. NBC_00223]